MANHQIRYKQLTLACCVLIGLTTGQTIDTCSNSFETMPLGNTGAFFQDLYSVWTSQNANGSNYNKNTRISSVCIWVDNATGSDLITGLHFSAISMSEAPTGLRTETQQTECYGGCTGTETCTRVKGDIVQFDMYSNVDGSSNDIHNVKFTTSNGQTISGTADETGNNFNYVFQGPFLGLYVYYDSNSLQDIGIYHGHHRTSPDCQCCDSAAPSPTAYTGDFATTDPFQMSFTVTSPANSATTLSYPYSDSPCPDYTGYTDAFNAQWNYDGSAENCGWISYSLPQQTNQAACAYLSNGDTGLFSISYPGQIQLSYSTNDGTSQNVQLNYRRPSNDLTYTPYQCVQRATFDNTGIYHDEIIELTLYCVIGDFQETTSFLTSQYSGLGKYVYIMDETTMLSTGTLNTDVFTFLQTPLCAYTETYTALMYNDIAADFTDALPSFITLDSINKYFTLSTDSSVDINGDLNVARADHDGTFRIQLTATLDDNADPLLMTTNSDLEFTVSVVDCDATLLNDAAVNNVVTLTDMSWVIRTSPTATQQFTVIEDTKSVTYGNGSGIELCGDRQYVLTVQDPADTSASPADLSSADMLAFVSLNGGVDTLTSATNPVIITVSSTDVTHVGSYVAKLSVSIPTRPLVPVHEMIFNINIATCMEGYVEAVPTAFQMSAITYPVYSPVSTPVVIPDAVFTLTENVNGCTPAYIETMTATLANGDPLPAWIVYAQTTGFTVDTNDIYNSGQYNLRLQSVLDDYVATTRVLDTVVDVNPCTANSFSTVTIPSMGGSINGEDLKQTISIWTDVVTEAGIRYCGARSYELLDVTAGGAGPFSAASFVTFDQITGEIHVDVNHAEASAGTFLYTLSVKFLDYTTITASASFTVELFQDIQVPANFPEDVVWTIGDAPYDAEFDTFWARGLKANQFSYSSTLSDGTALPNFITFDEAGKKWTLEGGQNYQSANYTIQLTVGLKGFPEFSLLYTWDLEVLEQDTWQETNTPPYFSPDLDYAMLANYRLACNESFSYTLPEMVDDEDPEESIFYKISFGQLANLFEWEDATKTMRIPKYTIKKQHNGVYPISITLRDQLEEAVYFFDLEIYCNKEPYIPPEKVTPEQLEAYYVESLPVALEMVPAANFSKPFLLEVNGLGEVTIRFEHKIKAIADWGKLKEDVAVVIDGKKVLKPVMELKIIPSENSLNSNLKMEWDFVEVKKTYLKIQMEFDAPEEVSTTITADSLDVILWSLEHFIVEDPVPEGYIRCELDDYLCNQFKIDDITFDWPEDDERRRLQLIGIGLEEEGGEDEEEAAVETEPEITEFYPGYSMKHVLKRQVPQLAGWYIKNVSLLIASILWLLIIMSVINNFRAEHTQMRLATSVLHTSIMAHFLLLNTQIPAFATMFIGRVVQDTYKGQFLMDLINSPNLTDEGVTPDPDQQMDILSFDEMGYSSVYFMNNTGILPFIFILFTFLWLIALFMSQKGGNVKFRNKKFISAGERLRMFTGRLMLPLLLFTAHPVICVASFINLFHGMDEGKEEGVMSGFQKFFSGLAFIHILLYPLFILCGYQYFLRHSGFSGYNVFEEMRPVYEVEDKKIVPLSEEQMRDRIMQELMGEIAPAQKPKAASPRKVKKVIDLDQSLPEEPDHEKIAEVAALNADRMKNFLKFTMQDGVLVGDFHVTRAQSGLKYLAALMMQQLFLTIIYTELRAKPTFQFMLAVMSQVIMIIILGTTDSFAEKHAFRHEMFNLIFNMLMLLSLIPFTDMSGFQSDQMSRQIWAGIIMVLFVFSMGVNFGLVTNATCANFKRAKIVAFVRAKELREAETEARLKRIRDRQALLLAELGDIPEEDDSFDYGNKVPQNQGYNPEGMPDIKAESDDDMEQRGPPSDVEIPDDNYDVPGKRRKRKFKVRGVDVRRTAARNETADMDDEEADFRSQLQDTLPHQIQSEGVEGAWTRKKRVRKVKGVKTKRSQHVNSEWDDQQDEEEPEARGYGAEGLSESNYQGGISQSNAKRARTDLDAGVLPDATGQDLFYDESGLALENNLVDDQGSQFGESAQKRPRKIRQAAGIKGIAKSRTGGTSSARKGESNNIKQSYLPEDDDLY